MLITRHPPLLTNGVGKSYKFALLHHLAYLAQYPTRTSHSVGDTLDIGYFLQSSVIFAFLSPQTFFFFSIFSYCSCTYKIGNH